MNTCLKKFGTELRMDDITCEMFPRVSRGLGHEKVRSSGRSGVHQDIEFIIVLQSFEHRLCKLNFWAIA